MANTVLCGITESAKYKIIDIRADYKSTYGHDGLPALMWVDGNLNPGFAKSFIMIGMYNDEDRSEIQNKIVTVDDVEIVLAISGKDMYRFQDKVLHYEDDEFVLQDPGRN
jgi:hypothetical protein